jgi:hypothetical protein
MTEISQVVFFQLLVSPKPLLKVKTEKLRNDHKLDRREGIESE